MLSFAENNAQILSLCARMPSLYKYLENLPSRVDYPTAAAHDTACNKKLPIILQRGFVGEHVRGVVANLPRAFIKPAITRVNYLYKKTGKPNEGNLFLNNLQNNLKGTLKDREEVQATARISAKLCYRHELPAALAFAKTKSLDAPKAQTDASALLRLRCPDWWQRCLQVKNNQKIEAAAIAAGFVHQFAAKYISNEGLRAYQENKRRNAKSLARMEALNVDTGDTVEMDLVIKGSLANPANRFAEMVTRARGFDEYAQAAGDVAIFYTITAPSKYHARHAKTGKSNNKYCGATPKQTQKYLCKIWAQIRAKCKRQSLYFYGFRVAEPHHDGTPHWHMLLYCAPEKSEQLTEILRYYAQRDENSELYNNERKKARFLAKPLPRDASGGGCVGYLIKYLAKNIGHLENSGMTHDLETGAPIEESAQRVIAWASVWRIRQFQQIGGARVGVWRELRRLQPDETRPQKFEAMRAAADSSDWYQFNKLYSQCPLALDKSQTDLNRYGEIVQKVCGVLFGGVAFATRNFRWIIREAKTKRRNEFSSARSAPWSCVNNCTQDQNQNSQIFDPFGDFSQTSYSGQAPPPQNWQHSAQYGQLLC